MNNQLTIALQNGSIRNTLISSGYGNEKDREKITKRLVSLITNNTSLVDLDPVSVLNVVLKMETLGVSPELETAYVVPYGNKAQFQLGYKGYVQLAMNTGLYKKIDCIEIKENDIKEFDLMTNTLIWNDDNSMERFKARQNELTIGWRAFAVNLDGSVQDYYMSEEEITNHLNEYSQAYKSKDRKGNVHNGLSGVQMRRKTVLKLFINRHLVKSMNLNEHTQAIKEALKFDSSAIEGNKPLYIDNPNNMENLLVNMEDTKVEDHTPQELHKQTEIDNQEETVIDLREGE